MSVFITLLITFLIAIVYATEYALYLIKDIKSEISDNISDKNGDDSYLDNLKEQKKYLDENKIKVFFEVLLKLLTFQKSINIKDFEYKF